MEGVEIKVSKADGDKCRRCWKYSTTVNCSPDRYPMVCSICVQVLHEINFPSYKYIGPKGEIELSDEDYSRVAQLV